VVLRLITDLIKIDEMDTTKFDIADYLDSDEMIAEYLNNVLAEGDDSDVIIAIGHIEKSIERQIQPTT